jgi:uncharacterized membrane protein
MARDRRRASGPRLDQPYEPRRMTRPTVDPERFNAASERIARFIGSWRFIGYMTAFVASWVLWNVFAPDDWKFDPWPFIGLTLMLSLQASYAAPLILLAQNRQADRDRVTFAEDRSRTDRLIADADYLTRELAGLRQGLGEVATRDFVRAEFRDLLAELLQEQAEAERKRKKERKRRRDAARARAEKAAVRAAEKAAEEEAKAAAKAAKGGEPPTG